MTFFQLKNGRLALLVNCGLNENKFKNVERIFSNTLF